MIDLSLLFAFQAGIITTISPCAFPLLPAYISYHLGSSDDAFQRRPVFERALRALSFGLAATLGFAALSGSVGLAVALGGRLIVREIAPLVALALGIGLLLLGFLLLASGRSFSLPVRFRSGSVRRGYWAVFVFGVVYGICAIGCTLPLFLLVIVNALTLAGFVGALLQFAVYASGMGVVLISVTVGAALFKGIVARGLRKALPYVEWLSTALVIQAGGYIVAYWTNRGGVNALAYLTGPGALLLGITLLVTLLRWKVVGRVMTPEV